MRGSKKYTEHRTQNEESDDYPQHPQTRPRPAAMTFIWCQNRLSHPVQQDNAGAYYDAGT
jgi:hypothetical protein